MLVYLLFNCNFFCATLIFVMVFMLLIATYMLVIFHNPSPRQNQYGGGWGGDSDGDSGNSDQVGDDSGVGGKGANVGLVVAVGGWAGVIWGKL